MAENFDLNDLARRLSAALPGDLSAVREDLENNLKAVLQASLSRMNLVTREELEVQQQILEKVRETVKTLESRIAALEAKVPKDTPKT
jgi:BMFP domain-containing protein YqiC